MNGNIGLSVRGVAVIVLALFQCTSCSTRNSSALNGPLPSFDQEITSPVSRLRLHPSQSIQLPVAVRNTGKYFLTSSGASPVLLSYVWYSGTTVLTDAAARTILPTGLHPGEEFSLKVRVVAPAKGRNLVLVISLVQEGVAWFVSKGAPGLRIPVDLGDTDSAGTTTDLVSDTRLSTFAEEIATTAKGLMLKSGETTDVPVTVHNPGPAPWSSSGKAPIDLSYRVFVGSKDTAVSTPRTVLPKPLLPGKSVSLNATVVAPTLPGQYMLRFSMVQEGVEWFISAGGRPMDIRLEVK